MDYIKKQINIVTSLNDKYTLYTVVLLTSIFETQTAGIPIHIIILYNSLTEENQQILSDTVEKYHQTIEFLFIDKSFFKDFGTNDQWSCEAYFRLMLPDLLPSCIKRFLYLDVDVIVNQDISEMYFTDMTNIDICAAFDVTPLPFEDKRQEFFGRWFEEGTLTYFCSGVTLWNLEEIRKKHSFESYIQIAKNINFSMVAPDQDILNIAHHNHIHIWDDPAKYGLYGKYSYNIGIHYAEVKDYSAIIHFVGQKPWLGQYIHYDIEQLWWDYAKRTPYYVVLLEDFMQGLLHNPLVYDTMKQSMEQKEILQKNLDESIALNQKLLGLLQQK